MTNPVLTQQKQKEDYRLANLRQERLNAIAKCYASKEALANFIKEKEGLLKELKAILPTLNQAELESAYLYAKTLLDETPVAIAEHKTEALYHVNELIHKANHRAFSLENQRGLKNAIRAYFTLSIIATISVPPTIIAFVAVLATIAVFGVLLSKFTRHLEKTLPKKIQQKTVAMHDAFTFFIGQQASKQTADKNPLAAERNISQDRHGDNGFSQPYFQLASAPPKNMLNPELEQTPFYQP